MSPHEPRLTPRQHEVLAFLRHFHAERGFAPTQAEIARGLGFRSPNAAAQHLRLLARKGVITIEPGVARGIRITDDDDATASLSAPATAGGTTGLPLVGDVAAGQPILAEAHVERRLAVAPEVFRPRADYLLRVRGDSMIDAGLRSGDLVAVSRAPFSPRGDIAVVRCENEVTVKYVQQHDNYLDLTPANADFVPRRYDLHRDEVTIEGRVVGLLRLAPEGLRS